MRHGSKPWPPWAHPAIVILLVTGCFHVYRGAPVDGVVFLAVALWLALTETRSPAAVLAPLPATPASWQARLPVVAVTLVLTLAPRYGDVDVAVVGVTGAAAVVVSATRADVAPQPRRGAAWPYAVVGLVAALNELAAYLLQRSPAADWRHPAMSDLLDPVLSWAPFRAVLVLAWLAGGLFLWRVLPARGDARAIEEAPGVSGLGPEQEETAR